MKMQEVAAIVWKECLQAKPNESALVISDPSGERLEIGGILKEACPCKCELVKMKPTGMSGREPSADVSKAMLGYDIVLAPTEFSITHTNAVLELLKKGGRVATMPGITIDMFLRAVPINYTILAATNLKLKKLMKKAKIVRVTTKAGTDITMRTENGRKVCNDNGLVSSGKVKNLPSGEVAIAPKEGSANGVAVFDISSMDYNSNRPARLSKPFRVVVRDGLLVECEHKRLWKLLSGIDNGTNLAELGIGTNTNAKPTGLMLEDEKIKGTAHIAFGTNADLGGNIQTSVHLDSVMDKPTIELDGKIIIKDGKFLF